MKSLASLALATLLLSAPVWADSLVHKGKTYNDVYIREGGNTYYVQDPANGSVTAVPRNEVASADVSITSDAEARQVLLNRWKAARADKPVSPMVAMMQSAVVGAAPAPAARPVPAAAPAPVAKAPATSGNVSIKLKNVPLRDALRATLRSQNLDYEVHDNYIYISTPQRLRQEPLERVQTRIYSLSGAAASDTLPKIVVRNPAANGYGGGMGGYGTMGMGNYGMGGGGYGMGGMGMGGYGGGGYGMGGMGGMGGGYGMGGMSGMGGMGMRGGMYGGGGQTFSNISDLFSTIDDRLVGETPAVIGIGGISSGPAGPPTR